MQALKLCMKYSMCFIKNTIYTCKEIPTPPTNYQKILKRVIIQLSNHDINISDFQVKFHSDFLNLISVTQFTSIISSWNN